MISRKKPVPPCRNCEDRTENCHNETCPHGWAEYEEQYHMFRQEIFDNCERYASSRTTGAKKRAMRHNTNRKAGYKK